MESSSVILIEGTCGVGKTSLIEVLGEALKNSGRAVRIFSQRDTYAPVVPGEDSGTLDAYGHARILSKILDSIVASSSARGTGHITLIDTLHITQFVRPGRLDRQSFTVADKRLESVGTRVAFLTAKPESIRRRAIEGRRGTSFYQYAKRFGATEDQVLSYFVSEQAQMRDVLSVWSHLPTHFLDAELATETLSSQLISEVHLSDF